MPGASAAGVAGVGCAVPGVLVPAGDAGLCGVSTGAMAGSAGGSAGCIAGCCGVLGVLGVSVPGGSVGGVVPACM